MAYFDNNATTPLHPSARESFQQAMSENWSNPSSPYRASALVRASMQKSREEICATYGVNPDHLVFTSGATEANNSVFSNLERTAGESSRVLISPYEHPSISEAAQRWFPHRVDCLSAKNDGSIFIDEVENYLRNESPPCLVAVMAASNESGVIQPWKEVALLCREHGIPYLCDSTQFPGKASLHELSLCTYNVASAHKFGGPKGIGWLLGEDASSLLVGGMQEKGRRGGTENFPAIISASTAWESAVKTLPNTNKLASLRDDFETQMGNFFPDIKFIGKDAPRLWNTSLFVLPSFDNLKWVGKLDKLGFQISTGSACATNNVGESPVASALKLSSEKTQRLLRVSSWQSHSVTDWEQLSEAFQKASISLEEEFADSSVISF